MGVRARYRRHYRGVDDEEILEAEHTTTFVDDATERAAPDRVEEPSRALTNVGRGVDLRAGSQLSRGVAAALALMQTMSAESSRPFATTPVARPSSRTTRLTSESARIVRLGRPRAGSM